MRLAKACAHHYLANGLDAPDSLCAIFVRRSKNGAPGAIPTRDLPLRRRTLYAAELREHM